MAHPTPSASAAGARLRKAAPPAIPPFWNRLNAFFLFPFQPRPLIYAVFLSLCSLAAMLSVPIAVITVIGILLATARYSFKVSAMASMGLLNAADFDDTRSDPGWTHLPWKFLGVLFVHGLVIALLASANEGLGTLGRFVSALLVPATLMVLIQTCSLRSAISPAELMRAVAAVGMPYLLLCLFMLLLNVGMPIAWGLLLPLAPKGLIAPVMTFVGVYFAWVSASMVGYVMYQNHESLDIDLVKDPQAELAGAKAGGAGDPLARERDAQVSDLIRQGQIREAYDLAYEWQRGNPENLPDQRRYLRVLLLSDKPDQLTWFTERYLQSLLKANKGQDALQVHESSIAKLPSLSLESAELTLTLAQLAWKNQNDKHALALLKGFDKRYPRDPAVPKAYELVARILHQGLGRTAQALTVYRAMQKHFAQHPATQEVAWLLRDHTGEGAAAAPQRPA